MSSERLFEADVIVIDTFSFLLVKDNTTEEECFQVIDFFKKLTNKNKTVVFTVDPQHLNQSLLTLLRGISDIYFELGYKSLAGEERKFIKINRFKKSTGAVSQIIPFRIQPGVGFIIEIAGLA
jgi:flagellar protein FlaH